MSESISQFIAHSQRAVRLMQAYLGRPQMVVQTRGVPVYDMDPRRSPIFLIGIERSETSLCRWIIIPTVKSPARLRLFFKCFANMLHDPACAAGGRFSGSERGLIVREIANWDSICHEAYRVAQGKSRGPTRRRGKKYFPNWSRGYSSSAGGFAAT